jgi:hypothetical protein
MYNIYLDFPGNKSLSVSHREAGINFGSGGGPDANLLTLADDPVQDLIDFMPLTYLTKLDYCARPVPTGGLARTFGELHSLIEFSLKA